MKHIVNILLFLSLSSLNIVCLAHESDLSSDSELETDFIELAPEYVIYRVEEDSNIIIHWGEVADSHQYNIYERRDGVNKIIAMSSEWTLVKSTNLLSASIERRSNFKYGVTAIDINSNESPKVMARFDSLNCIDILDEQEKKDCINWNR
ncbi:MAG: hypothetical protein ACN4E2_06165 [Nitrospinota bacterium]